MNAPLHRPTWISFSRPPTIAKQVVQRLTNYRLLPSIPSLIRGWYSPLKLLLMTNFRHPDALLDDAAPRDDAVSHHHVAMRNDPRDDDFPPVSQCGENASYSYIIRTTATGGVDLRVRDSNSEPLNEAIVSVARAATEVATLNARTAAELRAMEAKSRAIRNIMVPLLATAAVTLVMFRRQP